jgi:hypothetical protein
MDIANAAVSATAPPGFSVQDIMETKLANGMSLGAWEPFVRMMSTAGGVMNQDPLFHATAQMTGSPTDMEARKAEILGWRFGTPAQKAQYDAAMRDGGEMDIINTKLAQLTKSAA